MCRAKSKVSASLCIRSKRWIQLVATRSSVTAKSYWSVNSVSVLKIVISPQNKLWLVIQLEHFLFTGTLSHHGKHTIKKWRRRGTSQNNLVREGTHWDNIQDPCSHLSEALSHLPCLCREKIIAVWPWCQSPRYEKRSDEGWWICSGGQIIQVPDEQMWQWLEVFAGFNLFMGVVENNKNRVNHQAYSLKLTFKLSTLSVLIFLIVFCDVLSSGRPARSCQQPVYQTTALWIPARCLRETVKHCFYFSSVSGETPPSLGRFPQVRTRCVSAMSAAATTGKRGVKWET